MNQKHHIMKAKILSIILFCLISINAFADDGKKTVSKADVKQAVKEQIIYPQFALENEIEGEVSVSFIVSKEGKLIVKKINSTNIELNNLIAKKLKNIQLCHCSNKALPCI